MGKFSCRCCGNIGGLSVRCPKCHDICCYECLLFHRCKIRRCSDVGQLMCKFCDDKLSHHAK